MSVSDGPALSRRRVLRAGAAGLGAASAAGLAASCTSGPRPSAPALAARPLAEAVLEAFKTHRLVGLGEIHALQSHGDALVLLLSDPRLLGLVDDIVVEFGNALYQDTIDAFTAGQPVNDADLRLVWRNTVVSPLDTLDEPMYEQVYRTIRAANWAQPPGKRMRVLLGGPPIDWAKITTQEQFQHWEQQHAEFFMSLVQKEVVAKGRRALLSSGEDQFIGVNATVGGERTYRIADLVPAAKDLGGLASRLADYPRFTVIPTAGTWLGSTDAQLALAASPQAPGPVPGAGKALPPPPEAPPRRPGRNGRHPIMSGGNNFCGQRTGSLIEAGLYLGQPGEMTASLPNPAIYLDPVYWAELQRRNTLSYDVNLDWWQQQHPNRLPQRTPPRGKASHAGH